MSAVRFRVAIWLRHRWVSIALTALVVGVLGGSAMGVVSGTRRTDSAPDRLTRAAGGDPDLYLTQMGGDPRIDRVADISGVMSSNGYAFVLAFPISPVDGSAVTDLNPFAGTDDMLGSRIIEGRVTDPSNPDEFTINRALAADLKPASAPRSATGSRSRRSPVTNCGATSTSKRSNRPSHPSRRRSSASPSHRRTSTRQGLSSSSPEHFSAPIPTSASSRR